jgi:hypothetical protein
MDQTPNATATQQSAPERKPYQTPTLTDFGSLAEITQGASGVAAVDSGPYS